MVAAGNAGHAGVGPSRRKWCKRTPPPFQARQVGSHDSCNVDRFQILHALAGTPPKVGPRSVGDGTQTGSQDRSPSRTTHAASRRVEVVAPIDARRSSAIRHERQGTGTSVRLGNPNGVTIERIAEPHGSAVVLGRKSSQGNVSGSEHEKQEGEELSCVPAASPFLSHQSKSSSSPALSSMGIVS
jgi:hypothetical protein